jgi:hypothetical protein
MCGSCSYRTFILLAAYAGISIPNVAVAGKGSGGKT